MPTRILWIDDDEPTVEMATQFLKRRGLDVVGCTKSGDGLQRLRQDEEVAIVVTDLRMPGFDGFRVLAEASAVRASGRRFAIFVLTGHATPADEARAMELGADLFRQKPIDLPDLLAQVHLHLQILPATPSGTVLRAQGERNDA